MLSISDVDVKHVTRQRPLNGVYVHLRKHDNDYFITSISASSKRSTIKESRVSRLINEDDKYPRNADEVTTFASKYDTFNKLSIS